MRVTHGTSALSAYTTIGVSRISGGTAVYRTPDIVPPPPPAPCSLPPSLNFSHPQTESRGPDSRPRSTAATAASSRVLSSRGNPLFRSGNRDRGSFWRPNIIAGSATFGAEDEEEGSAERAGTRAVERAINGDSAPTAAVADAQANPRAAGRSASRRSGGSSLDASERGEGGGDGSSNGGQGRILFYHKPTLANVPAGDVPDVVPVYLGCPRGNMALGLPLNEAWQGEEHQVKFACLAGGLGESRGFLCAWLCSFGRQPGSRTTAVSSGFACRAGFWLWGGGSGARLGRGPDKRCIEEGCFTKYVHGSAAPAVIARMFGCWWQYLRITSRYVAPSISRWAALC